MASSSSVVGFVLLPMPQGEGGTQSRRAFPLRRGPAPHDHAAPRGGLHFGANPFSGGASERRAFAALLLLPKYRRFLADRMPPAAQIVLTNRRRHGVCRSSLATIMSTRPRSEERRLGKKVVSTCRTRGGP